MLTTSEIEIRGKKVMNNESNRKKFIWIHGGYAARYLSRARARERGERKPLT